MKKYKLKQIAGYECNNELVSVLDAPKRLIAIGDIHGDMDLMIKCFIISDLIKEVDKPDSNTITLEYNGYKGNEIHYYKWIGGNTVVVQVGDQVDRCRPFPGNQCNQPHTTHEDEASDEAIIMFFTQLHEKAIKHGGAVYSLLGNHELRNAMGIYDYVSYLGLKQYTPEGEPVDEKWRGEKFKRGKELSNIMACTRSSVMIVGNYMFVHGGFLEALIHEMEKYKTIYQDDIKKDRRYMIKHLNNLIKLWLKNPDFYSQDVHDLINGINSPFLARGLGYIPANRSIENDQCKNVKTVLNYFNIKGMVIGHTPQITDGINATCSKTIFRIDVASSKAFHKIIGDELKNSTTREPQVLEILNDCEVNVIKAKGKIVLKKCIN